MLPRTLSGIVGLLLLVGFLLSNVLGVSTTVDTSTFQNNMYASANTSYDGGIFSDLTNFGSTMWDSVTTIIKLATFQIEDVPTELSILFTLLSVTLIIELVKLIRGVT